MEGSGSRGSTTQSWRLWSCEDSHVITSMIACLLAEVRSSCCACATASFQESVTDPSTTKHKPKSCDEEGPTFLLPTGHMEDPPLSDVMVDLTDTIRSQNGRVTNFVGPNRYPITMPSMFLTRHSQFFRSALDRSGGQAYAEALSQSVFPPPEDVLDVLVLARYLIEKPKSLYDGANAHWPIACPRNDP